MFQRARPSHCPPRGIKGGRNWLIAVLGLILGAGALPAVVPEDRSPIAARQHRDAGLDIRNELRAPDELSTRDAAMARADLAALGVPAGAARLDVRGGGWATLLPRHPLLPVAGKTPGPAPSRAELEKTAWQAFVGFVREHQTALRLDPDELAPAGKVTVHGDGDLVQIHAPRRFNGIPVEGSYVHAGIRHGKLVLFGARHWGRVDAPRQPRLSADAAVVAADQHLEPFRAAGWSKPRLVLVPTAHAAAGESALGEGYKHRLSWVLSARIDGETGTWQATVDAMTGEVIAFEDQNSYAESKGGVLPVSNDGVDPDGVEQAGWPMPYDIVMTVGGPVNADSGGNFVPDGDGTSILSGQFVRMNDNCGAISLTSSGDLDFGISDGTDCDTPGFGGAGNTHASRSGFHELNRIAEMARSQLPANAWLQSQLTANMNINNFCNAFWDGATVNFYRSGGGCANTGELAGVFDHEWGHGMDDNDATPGVSSPGEGIADIYTALRLGTSCIGRNFRLGSNCAGYGDPCTECDGVRDIDFDKRASGNPHTFTWANANCGTSVHCNGGVYGEAVWSLWKRDLPALFGMDDNTAWELVNRLTYLGAGGVGTWFAGNPPEGGCDATGGYLNYLVADDDNGDLNDGTPHMTAIFAAFDRQEIACSLPAIQDSGCAGTPVAAPVVTATPLDKSVILSWNPVPNATGYQVFRTDGVFACEFGKVKVGETSSTSFFDQGLQNGRAYSYVVIPMGPTDACFGPASLCATASPVAGPNLDVNPASALLAIDGGDADDFLDNCETGTMTFEVHNTGLGTLTNVRVVGVSSPSHPTLLVSTPFPTAVSPSILTEGETAVGSFAFASQDGALAFGDTVILTVEVTADELPIAIPRDLVVSSVESDVQFSASLTFTFEGGAEGFTVESGIFARTDSGGGAQGTSWYEASSAFLDNQCDHIRSPVLQLTPASTLSLWNQYDIEPIYAGATWYDRANIGLHEVVTNTRTPVDPDGGRLYNADGPSGTCGTAGQNGWADTADTWAESTWSAAALGSAALAGRLVQIDVRYGTDGILSGFGFHFDQVTLTDVEFVVADVQSDLCSCAVDADCDDSASCTVDTCNQVTNLCEHAIDDAVCDNGLFCDGAETCAPFIGCQPGALFFCDDGVSCTVDFCVEESDSCDSTPNDALCSNGAFCDGAEVCDAVAGCQPAADPDPCAGQACHEDDDFCAPCVVDVDCSNGVFCDGAETCDVGTGLCAPALSVPDCDDGLSCTLDVCDPMSNACANVSDDAMCDNGFFCDGAEVCDLAAGCRPGATPCGDLVCHEPGQSCGDCLHVADFEDDAGGWINGPSTCLTGTFIVDTPESTTYQPGFCAGGTGCFFTASNPTNANGFDDVDGGTCEALSPAIDASGKAAVSVSLDYFHGQSADTGDQDGFIVDVLDDGAVVDTLVAFGEGAQVPAWTSASTILEEPGMVQLRVRVTDELAAGDFVEGGIDNARVCVPKVPTASACLVDDFETGATGWTHDPASTCTTGAWVTGVPTEEMSSGVITQLGGDHTTGSGAAVFTASNTTAGADDVDNGVCTLVSPTWNLATSSLLSVWYFHGQRDGGGDPSGDFFALEVSSDGGVTWNALVEHGDTSLDAAWTQVEATIPAGAVQLRVRVSDGIASGDVVEAGLDDLVLCPILFADDFESGNTSMWSLTTGGS